MPLFGNVGNQASNSVFWASKYLNYGSGPTNAASNNTALFGNTSPEVFQDSGNMPANSYMAIGQFALSTNQHANLSGESLKVTSAGWNLRKAYEGPVVSFNLTTSTATSANGESVSVSNGSTANVIGYITTNSAGNATSITFFNPVTGVGSSYGGRFVNTSILVYTFTRELHLLSITPTAAGSSGYTNGDIVLASNGIANGYGTITTNSTGNLASVALGTNATGLGLWTPGVANNTVKLTVPSPANTSATGGSFTANLTSSTGGVFTAGLGGRAGRVFYECLVGMGSIQPTNTTILPS